jgi:drug/metabolite transporter (DMT)-like permease
MAAVILSLLASVLYAAAYVLQYHEAHEAPQRLFLSPRLLLELLRHPIWLAGLGAMIVGNILQAFALGEGSLSVVEPLLTTAMLFALPLSAAWRRERLCAKDWTGALMVCGGLAVVLLLGKPGNGAASMSAQAWTLTNLCAWALTLFLVAAGRRARGPTRATFLAAGASVLFGLDDALTHNILNIWSHGFVHVVVAWQPYVLMVSTIYGLILVQSSYEAGPLRASLPALNVGEPIVGILIGIVALDEPINTGVAALFGMAAGISVMVYGVYLLARSPLVLGRMHRQEHPRRVDTGSGPAEAA